MDWKKFIKLKLIFIAAFMLLGVKTYSQDSINIVNSSPYQVIYNHLFYLQPETYQKKKSALSFQGTDIQKNVQNAIKMKAILDGKGLYVDINLVPDQENYVDSASNSIYTLFKSEPKIYVEKIDEKWYYSTTTVANINRMHKELFPLGTNVIRQYLGPKWNNTFLGLAWHQYLGLALLFTIGLLTFYILFWVVRFFIRRILYSRIGHEVTEIKNTAKAAWALSIYIVSKLMIFLLPTIQLNVKHSFILIKGLKIFGAVCLIIFLWRLVDLLMRYFTKVAEKTSSPMDDQLMPVMRRILKGILLIFGIAFVLNLLDVNLTALVAGISIGGLALALAAQDTVKNLIGSVVIFIDRPFQIGDWIAFENVDGTVEEVGMRSTRIRTFANSVTYVPNGKLADLTVNNMGVRLFRRYKAEIGITYDTPPHLIEAFIVGIRELIANHPYTRKDTFEVHLNAFNTNSLDILIYLFFKVPTWTAELEGKHDLMIGILKLAETLNIRFAFPTSTIHIENIPGQDSLTPRYNDSPEMVKEKVTSFLNNYTKEVLDKRGNNIIGE